MPDEQGNGQQPERPGQYRTPPRSPMMWFLLIGMVLVLVMLVNEGSDRAEQISLSEFRAHVVAGEIERIEIQEGGSIRGAFKSTAADGPDQRRMFELTYPPRAIDEEFLAFLDKHMKGEAIVFKKRSPLMDMVFLLLPWIVIFLILWFFVFRQLRNAGGGAGMLGNFGRSKHRVTTKEHTNITFADVAGVSEAKEEVTEIIEFLKNPKKFARLGGRIPRGVLLCGLPGCGKTLLARAIAGEADVPFFSISGSDFVEMFVGVGASRVRDLFKTAKDNSPCIIFLDEIDAVGRRRGANFSGGGHDEREQTLNAILVEMDGFETNDQVIVIAATNRVDVLDPALIRPGRFDRQVNVPLPDLQGRYEILKVHAKKIKLGPDADLKRLARGTPMFSGADLAAIINEAALIATMADKDYVEHTDLEESRDKVRWGRANKSRKVDELDRESTAYHEAGHALIQALETHADPVHKVSIIPRGPMGGATFSLPEKDRHFLTRDYLMANMRTLFGGQIAEDLHNGDVSTGVAQDIKQATEIARRMVKEWGMDPDIGFIYYGPEESSGGMIEFGTREYSDSTAATLDERIKSIIDTMYKQARQIMEQNRPSLDAIAKALLDHETITGDEVNALLRGESLERPGVSDLLDAETDNPSDIGIARPVDAPADKGKLDDGPLPQPG